MSSTYVGFDLETTGVSSFHDAPVSYGFVEFHDDGTAVRVVTEGGYVNPGTPIPAGAIAVHGITDAMVKDETPLADAVEYIAGRIMSVWLEGGAIVGMNVGYDLTMVDSLCRRLGLLTLAERGGPGPVLDVLVIDRHVDKWRKGKRTLVDLCRHYGVSLGNAHSAAADAEASVAVFRTQRARYPELRAIPLEDANSTLRAWYQEWLSSFSSFLVKKGEAPIGAGRYDWPLHSNA
jgi:DNA polymerase-3 subunit epsilon